MLPLGVTGETSKTYSAIRKKTYRSGMGTMIISNKKIDDIIKIAKSHEESDLLIKVTSEQLKRMQKITNSWIFSMLLDTLASNLY